MLLAVFGYYDAIGEIKIYFNLHSDFFKKQILHSTIYTVFDAKLIPFLRNFIGSVKIFNKPFRDKLFYYKNEIIRNKPNQIILENIDNLFFSLSDFVSPQMKLDDNTTFEDWYSSVIKEFRENGADFSGCLATLQKEFCKCEIKVSDIAQENKFFKEYFFDKKKIIDFQIKNMSSQHRDFNVLAAKLMVLCNFFRCSGVYICTASIFKNKEEWMYHYEKIINSKEPYEWNSFNILLDDIFNFTDISDMKLKYYQMYYAPEEDGSQDIDWQETLALFNDEYIVNDDIEFLDKTSE